MEYKIEQNVPVAPRNNYPFSQLKAGDSVLYPCTDPREKHRAAKAAYRCAEYHGWVVIARKLPEGVRVWRTEGKPLEKSV